MRNNMNRVGFFIVIAGKVRQAELKPTKVGASGAGHETSAVCIAAVSGCLINSTSKNLL
jgi:hypothetical protein